MQFNKCNYSFNKFKICIFPHKFNSLHQPSLTQVHINRLISLYSHQKVIGYVILHDLQWSLRNGLSAP